MRPIVTVASGGRCPVDDPDHPGALWMLTDHGQDVSIRAGFKSGYLLLCRGERLPGRHLITGVLFIC